MSTTVDGQKMRARAGEFDAPSERTYTKTEVEGMMREVIAQLATYDDPQWIKAIASKYGVDLTAHSA